MKISKIASVNQDVLAELDYDLIITSSGYESRATFLAETYDLKSENRICFAFKNHEDILSRKKNDRLFRKMNFRKFIFNSDDDSSVLEWIKKFMERIDSSTINILIDYSCMTRMWYSSLLIYFKVYEHDAVEVNLFFTYSLAKYSPPPKTASKNMHVGPIKGYSNITTPTLPTALIIGLGYIPERAYGLVEYLDAVPFLFYTDSSDGNQFSNDVEINNAKLLTQVPKANIYKYSIADPLNTFYTLTDLCKDIKNKYRVILAPCGPKPFTLICLLTGSLLEDLDVWRVSAGNKEKPTERYPAGKISTLKVTLTISNN